MRKVLMNKDYVKPNACQIKVSPTTILAGSGGTEGYNEKDGEGEFHSMRNDDPVE